MCGRQDNPSHGKYEHQPEYSKYFLAWMFHEKTSVLILDEEKDGDEITIHDDFQATCSVELMIKSP